MSRTVDQLPDVHFEERRMCHFLINIGLGDLCKIQRKEIPSFYILSFTRISGWRLTVGGQRRTLAWKPLWAVEHGPTRKAL